MSGDLMGELEAFDAAAAADEGAAESLGRIRDLADALAARYAGHGELAVGAERVVPDPGDGVGLLSSPIGLPLLAGSHVTTAGRRYVIREAVPLGLSPDGRAVVYDVVLRP